MKKHIARTRELKQTYTIRADLSSQIEDKQRQPPPQLDHLFAAPQCSRTHSPLSRHLKSINPHRATDYLSFGSKEPAASPVDLQSLLPPVNDSVGKVARRTRLQEVQRAQLLACGRQTSEALSGTKKERLSSKQPVTYSTESLNGARQQNKDSSVSGRLPAPNAKKAFEHASFKEGLLKVVSKVDPNCHFDAPTQLIFMGLEKSVAKSAARCTWKHEMNQWLLQHGKNFAQLSAKKKDDLLCLFQLLVRGNPSTQTATSTGLSATSKLTATASASASSGTFSSNGTVGLASAPSFYMGGKKAGRGGPAKANSVTVKRLYEALVLAGYPILALQNLGPQLKRMGKAGHSESASLSEEYLTASEFLSLMTKLENAYVVQQQGNGSDQQQPYGGHKNQIQHRHTMHAPAASEMSVNQTAILQLSRKKLIQAILPSTSSNTGPGQSKKMPTLRPS